MIRDKLVVGIRDNVLSERLQMDEELTLEKAMKMIRQEKQFMSSNWSSKRKNQILSQEIRTC